MGIKRFIIVGLAVLSVTICAAQKYALTYDELTPKQKDQLEKNSAQPRYFHWKAYGWDVTLDYEPYGNNLVHSPDWQEDPWYAREHRAVVTVKHKDLPRTRKLFLYRDVLTKGRFRDENGSSCDIYNVTFQEVTKDKVYIEISINQLDTDAGTDFLLEITKDGYKCIEVFYPQPGDDD